MCKTLNVSRSGYYEWTNNSGSNRAEQDRELMITIKNIFKEGRNIYGARRIKRVIFRKDIITSVADVSPG